MARCGLLFWTLLLLLLVVCCVAKDDDIEHDDPVAPTQPGCSNSFVLVRSLLLLVPFSSYGINFDKIKAQAKGSSSHIIPSAHTHKESL
jgi:hypothetical protein